MKFQNLGLDFRSVFTPPGYIRIHNNQFKVLGFHVTRKLHARFSGLDIHPNAPATIRMRQPSKCAN